MSKFEITPELVSAAFRLAAIGVEYAERMARAHGMSDAEVAAEWNRAKGESANDLGDYVRAAGGVWPPVADPADEPTLPGDVLYYDPLREDVTTFQSIIDVPRDRFAKGDRIYLTNPFDGGDFARFVFVLPSMVPRADVVQRFNATLIGYI